MNDFISIITEVVNASLHLYLAYFFFSSFWKRKEKHLSDIIFILFPCLVLTLSLLYLKGTPLIYFSLGISTFLITLLFDTKNLNKALFSVIYLAIGSIAEMLVALLLAVISSTDFSTGKQGILYIIGLFLSRFVFFIIILLIRMKKHSPLLIKFKKKYLRILLFPLSTLIIILLQHNILISSSNQSNVIYYAVLIAYVLLILANIIVFDFIDSLYENTVNENRISASNILIEYQKDQYKVLLNQSKNILKIRHDNRNFFIGLISDLESGKNETALRKLQEINNIQAKTEYHDGNVFNVLIGIKRQSVKDINTEILFEHHGIEKIAIDSTDLAIIVGNALDNAIEACQKFGTDDKKIIEVSCVLKNDIVLITITNPVVEDVEIGTLTTHKIDQENHGFGILSMKQIAEKYSGEVIFKSEDRHFLTSIILSNSYINE